MRNDTLQGNFLERLEAPGEGLGTEAPPQPRLQGWTYKNLISFVPQHSVPGAAGAGAAPHPRQLPAPALTPTCC